MIHYGPNHPNAFIPHLSQTAFGRLEQARPHLLDEFRPK